MEVVLPNKIYITFYLQKGIKIYVYYKNNQRNCAVGSDYVCNHRLGPASVFIYASDQPGWHV